MIDLIGDIHGHADKLEALLKKLGYKDSGGVYSHPERKVLFIGDYIDRGPKIRETLDIVRKMVDSGNAIALMGNHEYNALCFDITAKEGGHLRKHSISNILQHYETLKQFHNLQDEYKEYLEWFKSLPLYYESDTFRAVHACWDKNSIAYLGDTLVEKKLNDELIYQSVQDGTPLKEAVDRTLKGKEMKMPENLDFQDKEGRKRTEFRIKWWENPAEMTLKSISVEPIDTLPELPIEDAELSSKDYYEDKEKPVFFGHYWLDGEPFLFKKNICCLDYSVAKGGKLVAYRHNGDSNLDKDCFIHV